MCRQQLRFHFHRCSLCIYLNISISDSNSDERRQLLTLYLSEEGGGTAAAQVTAGKIARRRLDDSSHVQV